MTDSGKPNALLAHRREILASVVAAMASALPDYAQSTRPGSNPNLAVSAGSRTIFPVVATANGKVRGIGNGRTSIFRGIPYGASTAGANRFRPPQPVQPWSGVLECSAFREACPQVQGDFSNDYISLAMWDLHGGAGGMGEDCLNLNVWTNGIGDGVKRPVLVFLHGGAFRWGSGNGPQFDGARLARFGDAVVITVNHRLNVFGYLELRELGAPLEFEHAGIAGILDLVQALEWVKINVSQFGGDPDCVTIFGQSGGGGKVNLLMALPAAKGLFHRACVMSGSLMRGVDREEAARNSAKLLSTLGLRPNSPTALTKVDWHTIVETLSKLQIDGVFNPVIGTDVLPNHPFDPIAPAISANVPMMISTTKNDQSFMFSNFDMAEPELKAFFATRFNDRDGSLYRSYREDDPRSSPFLVQATAMTDFGFRSLALEQCRRRCVLGGAPTYLYQWDWAGPGFGGKYGAVHCTDLTAAFHLVRDPFLGAGAGDALHMSDRMSASLIAFARTGSPQHPGVPVWPAYDRTTRATMVFDSDMRVASDYRGDFVRKVQSGTFDRLV